MDELKKVSLQLSRAKNALKEAEQIAEAISLSLYQSNLELKDLLRCNVARYAVISALIESTSIKKAALKVVDIISNILEFEIGGFWEIDKTSQLMKCTYITPGTSSRKELQNFIEVSRVTLLAEGKGLPGRVWSSRKSIWIDDVTIDTNYLRYNEALLANLHSACAFPIIYDDKIYGVIEFYHQTVYPYGKNLMFLLNDATQQFRIFIERKKSAQKMETARYAGMSEAISSVLHNVGNVLNSVNTTANILNEKGLERVGRLEKFNKISKLLSSNNENLAEFFMQNEKNKLIPKYLLSLADILMKEQKILNLEYQELSRNVRHIITIISVQKSLSKSSAIVEPISIEESINNAIKIIGPGENIEVNYSYGFNELIVLDKIKFMQIIINLIQNAKEALQISKGENKKIEIQVKRISKETISITIMDNGNGLDKETLSKVFTFGFTTKKNGHGFGLHSSILLAKEMDGHLKVSNRKNTRGAKFTLLLPYRRIM